MVKRIQKFATGQFPGLANENGGCVCALLVAKNHHQVRFSPTRYCRTGMKRASFPFFMEVRVLYFVGPGLSPLLDQVEEVGADVIWSEEFGGPAEIPGGELR